MIKRLFKVANIFKPNKFNYALVDYLADELRDVQNIKCKKRNSYIKIKLDNPRDKYENLIVDCFNGKIYLRDGNNKDKKILNLNRFFGNRESDAMYCAKGGAKQIKKYLESINVKKDLTVEADENERIGMNKRMKDLRTLQCGIVRSKQATKIARRDIYDRDKQDGAIIYIDGNVIAASTHARAIHNYLTQHGGDGLFDTGNRPINWDTNLSDEYQPSKSDMMDVEEIENNINQLGFAHKNSKDMIIYLETETLQNVDANTVANAIKISYPNYEVYSDESEEKIARLKKTTLKKTSISERDFAIAIINGEVFDGDTHGEAITKYLKNIGIDDIEVYDRDELEMIMGHGFKNQFAAAHAKGDSIYIEPITLENITLNEAVNLIHDKYPEYNIYNVDSNERLAKLSRLKKKAGNPLGRKFAITYIDGNIYSGDTHAECVNKYLKDNNLPINEEQVYFRYDIDKNINVNEHSMGFGYMSSDKNIYIYDDQLINLSLEEFVNCLKKQYPNINILDEVSNEKFAKLTRKAWHDVSNRDNAMAYIDGEIYEGNTHAECISKYLKDHNVSNGLNDTQYRPNTNIEVDDAWDNNQAEDLQNIYDNIKEIAFCHVNKTNNSIYIEPEGYNITDMTPIANTIKSQYPDFNVYIDNAINDNYQKIARLKKAKIAGYHDKNNRTSAILYIEGNIFEGPDHYDMINEYLKEHYNIDRDDPKFEREANDLFDNLPYAMGSKVDEEKTIYIDMMTIKNTNEATVENSIKAKYPEYKIELEETTDDDLDEYVQEYTGYTMKELNDQFRQELEQIYQ